MNKVHTFDHSRSAESPPAIPAGCRGRVIEHARWEWRWGDLGDPLVDLVEFLRGFGLVDLGSGSHRAQPGSICGAALLVSAAGSAAFAGVPPGKIGPAHVPDVVAIVYRHAREQVVPAPADAWSVGDWSASWTSTEHEQAVELVRRAIAAGEIYQANLVGHWSAPYRDEPSAALARVADLPGGRYAGWLRGQDWAVATASPECLITVRDGRAVTGPIKGTRPATAQGARELQTSAKERAEHVMIVDLERNDLARFAVTGTVTVDQLFAIRRWCDLWQAESLVSATVRPDVGLAEILRAMCPGGSVTGAPKRAAMEIIAGVEPVGRGPSMGAIGFLTPESLDLGLSIRTVAIDTEAIHVWAGGGITWGSDPAAEVEEAHAKAAPLFRALAG